MKAKGLTSSTIKIIAIICMLIDHIGAAFIEDALLYYQFLTPLYYVMRIIGRISFPIFCFFIVEGFFHTRSKWKYALRLLIFAIVSEVPFDMAFYRTCFYWDYQNVFFTLLFGLLVIWGIDFLREKAPGGFWGVLVKIGACMAPTFYVAEEIKELIAIFKPELYDNFTTSMILIFSLWILCAIAVLVLLLILRAKKGSIAARKTAAVLALLGIGMLAADFAMTDYSSKGIVVIVLLYIFREKRALALVLSCIYLSLMNFMEIPAFLCLPLLLNYNGQRGKNIKYFFYAFYPVHLLIFGLMNMH